MPSIKPITIATRLETSLANDYRAICESKHIAPSTMLRVLVHHYVEECGYHPDPLLVADIDAKENQKRKPKGKR